MRPIPPQLTSKLASKPQVCARKCDPDHVCAGRITWEHAIIVAGKQLNEEWAIVFLCEQAHSIGMFLDSGDMNKEINIGLALNQAKDYELEQISKAVDYKHMRNYLNERYNFLGKRVSGRRLRYGERIQSSQTETGSSTAYGIEI